LKSLLIKEKVNTIKIMSYDRANLININPQAPGKPASRVGLISGVVILAVIVLILIIVVIVLWIRKPAAKKQCTTDSNCPGGQLCANNICVSCKTPTAAPQNVNVTVSGTAATISWSAVTGATSYNIYRKLEDPSVGVNNYHQKESTSSLNRTFQALASGTHYFVVTAINDCGESQPSSPVSIAPICSSIPATMAAPTVTQTLNDCGGVSTSDIVSVSFVDQNINNGVYVVRGTGQKGTVSNYWNIVQGNSFGPATGIHLQCGGVSTDHTVTQISEVQNAPLTIVGSPSTGSSYTVTWSQIAGAEQYVIFLVGVENSTGTPHYYGGYAPGTASSQQLATNVGDTLVFALVLGFRLCNRSEQSPISSYTTDN